MDVINPNDAVPQANDHQLRTLADTLPQLVWVTEPDGYHDFYNRRWYDYTGLSFEQTKGEGWNAVLHPDDRTRAWQVWRHSLETGDDYEIEYRVRRHDGVYRWFLGRALPLRDAAGRIVKWFGTCTDIHDQKVLTQQLQESKDELIESEKRFRSLAENSPDFITRHGRDFRYLYASPVIEKVTGKPPAYFIGKSYYELDLIPPHLCHLFDEHLARVIQSKKPHQMEYTVPDPGGMVYIYSRLMPEFDETGEVASVLVISTDVTEQRRSELALKESEARFRTLANSITQLAWMADPEGWIYWYNDRWYEFTGVTFEEVQGWGWQSVHHPEHVDRIVAYAREAWPRGEPFELTFPLRRHDGVYRWFLTRAFPIRDDAGNVVQWIGTNTDITGQKEAEEELEQRNSELEQFAYVSHHDLQEPIRKILIFADLLRQDSYDRLTPASRQRFDRIEASAQRMSMTLNDVMNYVSLQREEPFTTVDLHATLDVVLTDLELLIDEKGATVTRDDLPTLHAAAGQMQQLFYNLVNNALKFARSGVAPAVHIASRRLSSAEVAQDPDLDAQKPYYEITVRDNGIGFERDVAEKIFGMFQRLHTREAYPGTGIGLALCKKVVLNHGGKISAESAPNVGTTFRILLPER